MRAIVVDDEPFSLEYLGRLCLSIPHLEVVGRFDHVLQAVDFIRQQPVDLALLDIEMPGLNGIEAAKEMKRLSPGIGIVFVTSYEQYALQAFQMEAVSYLMKPCLLEELQSAVARAKRLLTLPKKRVEIRTFGSFSVLVDGTPLRFSNRKAKELLAVLVDRNGSVVNMEQATELLWETRPYDITVKRLYRKAVSYLNQISKELGLDFFVSNRGSCHMIPSRVDCDYFDLLQKNADAAAHYDGEYMTDYSWAETTNGRIAQFVQKYF